MLSGATTQPSISGRGASTSWAAPSSRSSTQCNRRHVVSATDPAALQDVIVGGAVTAAVGAALFSGLKKEPEPCDLCAGNGGIRCFACSGGGTMEVIDKSILTTPQKRDIVGRSKNPRSCRVCGGSGLVLCSKCRGSGFVNKF